jgi:hypothetical protein
MLTRIVRRFATTTNKTYGNLKDSDRIFTNVYKDSDPYISGALRRVTPPPFREIGIAPRTSSAMEWIGSSTKSKPQDSEEEEEQGSPQDSNTPSCPKSPLLNDPATSSSTLMSLNPVPARTGKSSEATLINWSKEL